MVEDQDGTTRRSAAPGGPDPGGGGRFLGSVQRGSVAPGGGRIRRGGLDVLRCSARPGAARITTTTNYAGGVGHDPATRRGHLRIDPYRRPNRYSPRHRLRKPRTAADTPTFERLTGVYPRTGGAGCRAGSGGGTWRMRYARKCPTATRPDGFLTGGATMVDPCQQPVFGSRMIAVARPRCTRVRCCVLQIPGTLHACAGVPLMVRPELTAKRPRR